MPFDKLRANGTLYWIMTMPYSFPGDISVDTFLQQYWQKKPLLIRKAFPGIRSPLTPDELAGLACEDGVNSRIVFEQHELGPWHVEHGPFDDDDFSGLPEYDWTLLVTDVEKHVPEARQLIDRFRFIPDWRTDDLMISYAPEGGSVGPHTDAYDVFLIQVHGQRRWMINQEYDDACLEGPELSILKHFTAARAWILDPGDMLYLPPNVAHHGIAVNECMTCSVGFRAPSCRSVVSEYAESIAAGIDRSLRYQDPDLQCQQHPAEITEGALTRIRSMVAEKLTVEDESFVRWFGRYCSESRGGNHAVPRDPPIASYGEFTTGLTTESVIIQSPAAKFLFARIDGSALLFVDGNSFTTSPAFASTIADNRRISAQQLIESIDCDADQSAVVELCNHGYLLVR